MRGARHDLRTLGLAAAAALCALFLSGLASSPKPRASQQGPSLSRKSPVSTHLTREGEAPRLPAGPSLARVDDPRFPAFAGGRSSHSPAARLEERVSLVARLFCPHTRRQDHGRVADRPLLLTCPAQGPPARV